jgi:hypothetical protein
MSLAYDERPRGLRPGSAVRPQPPPLTARQKLEKRARAARQKLIRQARVDPVAFAEFVLVDEVSQLPIRCAPIHREWQAFLSANAWAVLVAPVEHGKTSQLVGRVLWEIGKNPDIRIGWISLAEEQAFKVVAQVRRYIEESSRLREVFPNLKRSTREGHLWNKHALEVERSPYVRDPTIRGYGSGTKIPGARLDLIVCDDVLDRDNTSTLEQSQKMIDWFDTSVLTRAQDDVRTGVNARLWVVGTPWADHDLLHELPKRKSFANRIFCAVQNPDDKPSKWRPCWPEQWNLRRLLVRLNGMLPSAFARKYLCRVVNDVSSRFPEWAINMALEAGRGLKMLDRAPMIWPGPRKLRCWTGVDLGVGEEEGHDLTTLVTVALRDDMRRQIVKIESGNWTSDVIMDRIAETHYRYDSRMIVESVAAQKWLLQFVRKHKRIPVEPYQTTGQSKWDEVFGVESLAVELRQKLWIFPSGHEGNEIDPELFALRFEMLGYRPKLHTGDRLMGLWFAREGIRRTLGKRFR